MKIESLNTWGGRVFEPLMQHFKDNQDVDVFCLQEIYSTPTEVKYTRDVSKNAPSEDMPGRANLFEEIAQVLPNHEGFFSLTLNKVDHFGEVDFELQFGQAIFVRKDINVLEKGESFVFGDKDSFVLGDNTTQPRVFQYMQLEHEGKRYAIGNFHGTWTGSGKGDTPSRIEQSNRVRKVIDSLEGSKILCGDFNLSPDTESLSILEKDMKNLIKEYGITSTRSKFYTKDMKFADYILVSPEITVKNFRVLQEPVSDHLPLQLEIA